MTKTTSIQPKRIQRKRTKGWRMPPNAVYVGRPSRWGNDWMAVGTDGEHTRAFPTQLAIDMIRVFPNAKLVFDPFMGSGTTGVASQRLGKDFIGFELDENYFKLAEKRINEAKKQVIL